METHTLAICCVLDAGQSVLQKLFNVTFKTAQLVGIII